MNAPAPASWTYCAIECHDEVAMFPPGVTSKRCKCLFVILSEAKNLSGGLRGKKARNSSLRLERPHDSCVGLRFLLGIVPARQVLVETDRLKACPTQSQQPSSRRVEPFG